MFPTMMPMQKMTACVTDILRIIQMMKKMTPSAMAITPIRITNLLVNVLL